MKKLFLIFTVLFTCALPVSGFGDVVTNNRNTFNDLTQGFSNKFTQFQTESQDKMQQLRSEQQEQMEKMRQEQQEKMAQMEKEAKAQMEKMRREQQEQMDQLKQKYDTKLNELKEKAPKAFRDIELSFAEYIRNTPFENCDLGYSSIKCYKDNNKTYSAWACTLKPGITKEKMNQDVQKHCSTIRQELEFKPDIPETTNANDTETDEENDTPIRMTAQVEELSPEAEVNAHDEHDPSQDSQGAPFAPAQNNAWNTNYNDSNETPDSAPSPTQDKSASAMIAQEATRKAEKNKETCTPVQRDKINATNCKISPDGKYSDIECKAGYTKNTDGTKCEKSDTPDKKAKPELIKISGIVIEATTSGNEQTIGGVRIKYDEGKKDKDGNKKYAQHQTGNNGRFAINIVPGSTITFTHKMYQDITTSYSVATKDEKIKMTHKSLAAQHGATVGEPCPDDVLKILNAESGTYKKDATTGSIYCNIKKCTSNLKITKTEKPEPINFTDLDIMLERCECPDNLPVKRSQNGVLECIPEELIHISGYVTNYKNEALPGVKIKIDKKTIKTDPSGHFTLSAQIGAKILLSHKGYEDYTHTIWADNTNPTIVMIEANAKNIQRGGNVIDEKGDPMPNITIKYGNKKIQTDKDGRFDITAPKGTVMTLSAKGYEDIKITLDEDCPNCDIDMTPTEKSANNAKKKELCEADGPNKGKWNETFKTCNCKGKTFFDEDKGCVESTQDFIDDQNKLNQLYEQFGKQLKTITTPSEQ